MSESKRNHHVPRFLLNRFASQVKGKSRFVWQFSESRPPVEISTKDAGVSEYFYGEPVTGIERQLQTIEGPQATALAKIDAGEPPVSHSETLRQLLWTLAVRTRALRQSFVSVAAQVLDHFESSAGGHDAGAALLAQANRDFDGLLLTQLNKLPPAYRDRAIELLENPERRDAFRKIIVGQLSRVDLQGFVSLLLKEAGLAKVLNKSAADGQIRGLSKLLDRSSPPPSFAPEYWTTIKAPPGTFVLGDSCVFGCDDCGHVATMFALGEKWRSVYLPISDSVVLVAARSKDEPILGAERINVASVELAADLFFASTCTQREIDYVPRIGSVPLLTTDEVANMARDSWRNLATEDGKR